MSAGKSIAAVGVTLAALAFATAAWSKGVITKITIQRVGAASAREITDPAVLQRFAIWSGPGVVGWDMAKTVPSPDDAAFIIDWTKGKLSDAPRSTSTFRVTMYVDEHALSCNKYEVLYRSDGAGAGHVYLPRWDEEFGRCNMSLIARDVEGNWFHASAAWNEVVKDLGSSP